MQNSGQKKAEKLSQCFGLHLPMKTTLLGKGININPKAMPIKKEAFSS